MRKNQIAAKLKATAIELQAKVMSNKVVRATGKWYGQRSNVTKFLISYSLIFAVIAVFLFVGYFLNGNTFVHQTDGYAQHYRALLYYGEYLREIARNILSGNWVIPTWDFAIGMGGDIITTMQHYCLGEPLSLLAAIVPQRFTWLLFGVLIIIRLYLSGLTFAYLCRTVGWNKNRLAILAGSVVYVFCVWQISYSTVHTMFALPMIFLPLIIAGVERILRGRLGWVLTVSVFLLAISNFYFFGVCAILTVIYTVIRMIITYRKDFKLYIRPFLRIAFCALLGTLLAAFILLPVGYATFSSGRSETGTVNQWLYPLYYYSELISAPISIDTGLGVGANLVAGVTPVAMLGIFILFRRHDKNSTKNEVLVMRALVIACALITIFPMLAKVTNGFMYADNRWSFAIVLVIASSVVLMWSRLTELKRSDAKYLAICLVVYVLLCLIFRKTREEMVFASLAIMAACLFGLTYAKTTKARRIIAFASIVIGAMYMGFCVNDTSKFGIEYDTKNRLQVQHIKDSDAKAAKKVAESDDDNGFYRYSGRSMVTNAGLTNGVSSTSSYWSIVSPYIGKFYKEFGLLGNHPHWHDGYDDRSALLSLASVKYYTIPNDSVGAAPYGFTYVKTVNVAGGTNKELKNQIKREFGNVSDAQIKVLQNRGTTVQANDQATVIAQKYKVYRNNYAMPLGYTYNNAIDETKLDKYNEIEREEIVSKALAVSNCGDKCKNGNADISTTSQKLDYTLSHGKNATSGRNRKVNDGVTRVGNSFVVTSKNAMVRFSYNKKEAGTTYLRLNGLKYRESKRADIYSDNRTVDPDNLYNDAVGRTVDPADLHKIGVDDRYDKPVLNFKMKVLAKSNDRYPQYIDYKTEYFNWYANRHNFVVNVGYSEPTEDAITVTFPQPGIYSFDSIDVINQPMDNYEKSMNALREDTLKNVKIGTNQVTGNIDLDKSKWLALSIPYSDGWTAYVDGKETKLYRANIQFMALHLDPGKHKIKLVYHTPLLNAGLAISGVTVLIIVGILWNAFLKKKVRI